MTAPSARPSCAAPTLVVALALAAQSAAPAAAAVAGAPSLEVKVGRADAFSRIELHGARPTAVRREGRDLVLRFPRAGAPDMARLHVDPPPHVEKADAVVTGAGVELRLTAAADADIRTGFADGATWINFVPATPVAGATTDAPKPAGPDPVPRGGVVPVRAEAAGRALHLRFAWRAPVAAAVFRRGEAVWVVFDAAARLDLSGAPHGLPQVRKVEAVSGPGWSGVRIASPAGTPVAAAADGGVWTVALGPEPATPLDQVGLDQDLDGPAALTARVAGVSRVIWLSDPVVGDRLAVAPALAPAKGLSQGRGFVGAELLASAHGLAVRAVADDLQVVADGDLVRIGRPRGLALSRPGATKRAEAAPTAPDLPAAAASPAFVDFAAWSKTGEGGFRRRYDDLLAAASAETALGKGAPVAARLGLARFLAGSELAFEAVGVLNLLLKTDPTLSADPEFRGLRGASRAMAGRWKDAEADFSTPVTADDPACALWRGYVAWRLGDMAGARAQFARGRPAAAAFVPKWRARFARADAEAAIAGGDLQTARSLLGSADATGLAPEEADGLKLASARLAEAAGDRDRALGVYLQVAKSPLGALSAPAMLRATQIQLATGRIATPQAMATLDSLRFRWRGDAVELETIRALGQAYLEQGRYRETLAVLRSAGGRLPDLPQAAELQADLASAFKTLFLDGQADGLQPIQALALFYDFKELTPIGADGDRIVRRLVRRLVDVDLLDQAADLLRYQVDNRLDGVARAQVATDLALIELMARKPEPALGAISASRTTLLPAALNAQRRVIEARALVELGRPDHALEVLGKDAGPDASEVRALIAWRGKDWPAAARAAELRLGERWRDPRPLDGAETSLLLRAGAAYSLAHDDAALTRLRTRYSALADGSGQPEALHVALAGFADAPTGNVGTAVAQASGDAGLFAGWVARMKARFREAPAPLPAPVLKASGPGGAPTSATGPRSA